MDPKEVGWAGWSATDIALTAAGATLMLAAAAALVYGIVQLLTGVLAGLGLLVVVGGAVGFVGGMVLLNAPWLGAMLGRRRRRRADSRARP